IGNFAVGHFLYIPEPKDLAEQIRQSLDAHMYHAAFFIPYQDRFRFLAGIARSRCRTRPARALFPKPLLSSRMRGRKSAIVNGVSTKIEPIDYSCIIRDGLPRARSGKLMVNVPVMGSQFQHI